MKNVLDSAGVGVYGLDLKGRTTFANKTAVKILGYGLAEMMGKNQHQLIHHHYPDGRKYPEQDCRIYQAFRDGKVYTVQNEVFWNKRGKPLAVKYTSSPLKNDDGKIIGAVVVFHDISKQVKGEQERQQTDILFRTLAHHGNDIVILEDVNSIVKYASPALTRHLGIEVKDAIGKNSWDLVQTDDRKKWFPRWQKIIFEEKGNCVSELRFRHRDGHYIWFESLCSPVLDSRGEVSAVVSVSRDITERKAVEEKLEMIASNTSDIITLRDAEGKVVYTTPSFKRQLGYDPEKEKGHTPRKEIFHPDDAKRVKEWWHTVYEKGEPFQTDIRLKTSKGKYVWYESHTEPVKDARGRVIAAVTSSRDLTDYKRAESESLRLGHIIEDSLNEIYVFDQKNFRLLTVNRGARKNLGYSMKELKKMTPPDIKPEYPKPKFKKLVEPLLSGKKEQIYFETVHKRKDGSTYDVEVYLQLSKVGPEPVFVAIIEDITQKKADQERLRQLMKMEAIGNLSGGIAHDFNNLLTAIQGSLQLMKLQGGKLSKEARECLEIALKSTKRGTDLTSQLLAFSRRQTLKPAILDANVFLEDFLVLLKRTIDESITIETQLLDEPALIKVDETLLGNALLNLAVNARDAMPEGGNLLIEVSVTRLSKQAAGIRDIKPGRYIVISITDDGAGMPEEVKNKIFEPFFSTKGMEKGTGLGLSMVYGFVKQSGGYINVYSEQGRGTTFKLYFKAAKGKIRKKKKKSVSSSGLKGNEIILLVEDDEGVRNFVSKALKSQGYRVLEAPDGEEAKALIGKTKKIDLLLTDVVLPKGFSGVDVGKSFKNKFPKSPVIYSSGYTAKAGARKKLLPKGEKLLSKPYDIEVLFSLIKEKLSGG